MDVDDDRLVEEPVRVAFTGNVAAALPRVGGGAAPEASPRRTVGGVASGLWRTMRPRQWIKNALVFAAPLASGTVVRLDVLAATVLAFALFCVAASGLYLLNDVRDVEEDRRHPRKRTRPVASGAVPVRAAVVTGVVLLVASLGTAAVVARPALTAVLATYVVISLAYSLALKDQPVIDLACVASGFVLRGVAGGAAAGVALSQWFILVSAFGALFMVAGKRYAEILAMGERSDTRRSLGGYSASYLRFVWSLSAGVACTTYGLWAFEMRTDSGIPWTTISVAPFVLALLRYAVDVDRGSTGAPEEVVLRDRGLLALGLVWAVTVGLGVLTG